MPNSRRHYFVVLRDNIKDFTYCFYWMIFIIEVINPVHHIFIANPATSNCICYAFWHSGKIKMSLICIQYSAAPRLKSSRFKQTNNSYKERKSLDIWYGGADKRENLKLTFNRCVVITQQMNPIMLCDRRIHTPLLPSEHKSTSHVVLPDVATQ